jgi:hypothetical protein
MSLARNGDPYIATNGKLIEQSGISQEDVFVMEENRKTLPAFKRITITKRIFIENLPEPDGRQQTIISAIIGLRLLGLSDVDIADVTNSTIDDVKHLSALPATQATFERIYQNIIHTNSDTAQGRIAAYANSAVDVVVSMMNDEDTRADVRLKAAQDILDRSGTNAEQFFGETAQQQQHDDELRIVVTDESGQTERVKIDIRRGGSNG